MDALSSLAVYSDSEEDEDLEMQDQHESSSINPNIKTNENVSKLLSLNLYNSPSPRSSNKSTPKSILIQSPSPISETDSDIDEVFNTAPPEIPPSPDIKPDPTQQNIIKDLLKKHKTHKDYYRYTFKGDDFQDKPEWFDHLLSKLQLFEYSTSNNANDSDIEIDHDTENKDNSNNTEISANTGEQGDTEWKLDEYASNLSESIHEITQWRHKEDNVDTLMRLLEAKIRENEQRIREKREKKERERQQMMKERIERRIPTPTINTNYGYNQSRYANAHNLNVMNAAKNAVLAKKNQFILNKNKELLDKKKKGKSRWDDKQ